MKTKKQKIEELRYILTPPNSPHEIPPKKWSYYYNDEMVDYLISQIMKVFEKKVVHCPLCGKPMKKVKDSITKTKTGYLWKCSCNHKKIISIG